MRRFFLNSITQGVKLSLRDAVNFGGALHHGHREKLGGKAQIQFVGEADVFLQRSAAARQCIPVSCR
jgi:hypothetical protein